MFRFLVYFGMTLSNAYTQEMMDNTGALVMGAMRRVATLMRMPTPMRFRSLYLCPLVRQQHCPDVTSPVKGILGSDLVIIDELMFMVAAGMDRRPRYANEQIYLTNWHKRTAS